MSDSEAPRASNFIRHIVTDDQAAGKHGGRVVTRFPPEPNGYLHIGHAKAICLNFGIAEDFGGRCNLRMDDTNPAKESMDYVNAIQADVSWLGYQWSGEVFYASDYYEKLYEFAASLIGQGKAFVCSLNAEQMREFRGTLTEPGRKSPDRDRSVAENLDLFKRMRAGEFADGQYVLRAKIDMAAPNINLRDPVIYRIMRHRHYRTGDTWCIYPMYDFTHPISDALEGITHSLCTLEFEDHRPLYDWVLDNIDIPCHPQQIEFSRLNLEYTVMSKRKLNALVTDGDVSGWDDPRMPTISGLRRRGYTPTSIRGFCERIGVTKVDTTIEAGVLENCIREDPQGEQETLVASNHPKDESMGTRELTFGSEIYIDHDDFAEVPPPGWKRLIPGGEVRLRNSYVIKCEEVIKDADGNITELRATYDAETLGKKPEGRKVKGVVHWANAADAVDAEVRLYDRLFSVHNPGAGDAEYREHLNPESLQILRGCKLEASLSKAQAGDRVQFEREGYFCCDQARGEGGVVVFNRTVTLRDSWAKQTGGK
jgi:glutaminyl-tRNA synthetase